MEGCLVYAAIQRQGSKQLAEAATHSRSLEAMLLPNPRLDLIKVIMTCKLPQNSLPGTRTTDLLLTVSMHYAGTASSAEANDCKRRVYSTPSFRGKMGFRCFWQKDASKPNAGLEPATIRLKVSTISGVLEHALETTVREETNDALPTELAGRHDVVAANVNRTHRILSCRRAQAYSYSSGLKSDLRCNHGHLAKTVFLRVDWAGRTHTAHRLQVNVNKPVTEDRLFVAHVQR